jgi:hypothetical protein
LTARKRFPGFLVAAIVVVGTTPALAAGEIVISATGETTPTKLRGSQATPATLSLGFTSEATDSPTIPDLSRITLQISRNVSFQTAGLPSCPLKDLYSRTASAGRICAGSLVGHGSVASEITLPDDSPVSVEGHLLAFYSSIGGVPRILAQVTTAGPVALTYVFPFQIGKAHGAFGTGLVVQQMAPIQGICVPGHPDCFDDPYTFKDIYGHISNFKMSLHRLFTVAGAKHSFVTARCPAAPSNTPETTFPIVRANLAYRGEGNQGSLTATATSTCLSVPAPPARPR